MIYAVFHLETLLGWELKRFRRQNSRTIPVFILGVIAMQI